MNPEENKQTEAMDKAMSLLASRGHSRRELYFKLIKRKYGKKIVERVLDECERLGFLNDHQFAEDLLEELKRRGYGAYRIRASLSKKGVPNTIVEEVLEADSGDDEVPRATQALETKRRALLREGEPRKRREKAFRFLAGRGFNSDSIRRALEMSDLF